MTYPFPIYNNSPVFVSSNLLATDQRTGTANATTQTYLACNIGTASASRLVVVVAGSFASSGGSARTITSATIGGVAATVATSVGNAGARNACHIIYALVTTGTTADVVINYNALTGNANAIEVYVASPTSTTPQHTATVGSGSTGTVASRSLNLNVYAGGFYVVATAAGQGTLTGSTTGPETLVEDMDVTPTSPTRFGAHSAITNADGTSTITVALSINSTMCICAASWL